jgi:hypothetical protein
MGWTLTHGQDNDGPFIVKLDEGYRNPAKRIDLTTRISFRFLGNAMQKSEANRDAFEKLVQPFLIEHGGSIVMTVARRDAYTFIAYCRTGNTDPTKMPLVLDGPMNCTLTMDHDAEWVEYDSWLPSKMSGPARAAMFFRVLRATFSYLSFKKLLKIR